MGDLSKEKEITALCKRGRRALRKRRQLYMWWQDSGPDRNEDSGWIVSILPREEVEGLDEDEREEVCAFLEGLSDEGLGQLEYQHGKRLSAKTEVPPPHSKECDEYNKEWSGCGVPECPRCKWDRREDSNGG